jgi:hypothetical protein
MPEITVDYLSVVLKLIISLVVVAVTWLAYRIVRNVIKRRIKDTAHMHTLRMLVRNAFLFAGSVIVLMIWLGVGSNLTVAISPMRVNGDDRQLDRGHAALRRRCAGAAQDQGTTAQRTAAAL